MIVIGLYADESEEVVWFEQKRQARKTNSTVACNIYSIYSFAVLKISGGDTFESPGGSRSG